MRVTVESTRLAEALKHSASPNKSTLDLLQFARLTAREGELFIETTDTEVFSAIAIAADVHEEGVALLNETTLRTIAAGGKALTIAMDGSVSRGRSRYRVGAHPSPGDLPGVEQLEWERLDLSPTTLAEAISHVAHAADDKDVRAFCRVIFLEDGRVWATDGKLAARKCLAYTGPRLAIPCYQVPRILDAMGQPEAYVRVGRAPGVAHVVSLQVRSPSRSLTVRTVETGKPIPIEQLVPDPAVAAARVKLDRKATIDALRRFAPFSAWKGEKGVNHVVALDVTESSVVISDRAGENVEHLTEDGAAIEQSGQIRTGINPKQLISVLGALRTEFAVLHLAKDLKGAALVQADDTPVEEVAHIIMPIVL